MYSLVVRNVSVPAMGAVVVLLAVLRGEPVVALAAHEPRRAAWHRQATGAAEEPSTPRLGLDVELPVAGNVQYQLVRLVRHYEAHAAAVVARLVLEVPVGLHGGCVTPF